MTLVARTDGNGTVHELPFKRFGAMARDTEFGSILTHVQQKLAGAAVWLMAGKTVTIFYRRVHYFLFTKGVVTLRAETRDFDNQFPAFSLY